MGEPVNGVIETGWPERFRLDELIRRVLAGGNAPREVVAVLDERTLLPADDAPVGEIRFDDSLAQSTTEKVAAA